VPREMTSNEVRSFLSHGPRTAKVATVMDDGRPHVMPVWFVLDGEQTRYMGQDRADEFGKRNAVPGELLIRVTPERVIGEADVAGY
jgi:hypothetical protein